MVFYEFAVIIFLNVFAMHPYEIGAIHIIFAGCLFIWIYNDIWCHIMNDLFLCGFGARFTNEFSVVIQIRLKFHFALIQVVMTGSLRNFAHGMTGTITLETEHAQTIVAIWQHRRCFKYNLPPNSNYEGKVARWTLDHIVPCGPIHKKTSFHEANFVDIGFIIGCRYNKRRDLVLTLWQVEA